MQKIKFGIAICSLLGLITFVRMSSAQSESPDVASVKQQFTAEIRSLRTEILQQGIEFQEWKVKQLTRDLQRIKSEREQLDEAAQNIRRQIANIDQSIAAGASSEQEGMKAKLNGTQLQGVQNKSLPLVEQESEVYRQLEEERQHLQALQAKLKSLKGEGLSPSNH